MRDNRVGATAMYGQALWSSSPEVLPIKETTKEDLAFFTTWLFETDNLNECTGYLFV